MGAYLTWTTKDGQSKSLFFDVTTEESQDLTSTPTEYPVEDGANVADHVKDELDKVTLEVFVSQTPIYDMNNRGGRVEPVKITPPKFKAPLAPTPGAVYAAVGGLLKDAIGALLGKSAPQYAAQVLKFPSTFDAVADTLTVLEKIRDEKQLVTVVLPSKDFENMCLVHVGVRGNAGTGTGRSFTLEFHEMRKVKVSIVNAPVPTQPRANVQKPKGNQGPKDVNAIATKSVAKSAFDLVKKRLAGKAD